MADANPIARFFSDFTPTTWSVIVLVAGLALGAFKVWPLLRGKINEARKIELDADADLRGDLFRRIKELEEAQHRDRLEFYKAMGDERKRCDEELDAIRARLTAAERHSEGLQRQLAQNAQSTAQLLGDHDTIGRPSKGD